MSGLWTVIFIVACLGQIARSFSNPWSTKGRVNRYGRRALRKATRRRR